MHSVGSIGSHDLGVFIVSKIAMKNTDAVTPVHPISRTPKAADPGLQGCCASRVPLELEDPQLFIGFFEPVEELVSTRRRPSPATLTLLALNFRENCEAKSLCATYGQPGNCQTRDLPSAA
jgi:hypothetical protein